MTPNSRILLTVSAIFNGTVGLLISFFPQEILQSIGLQALHFNVLILQVLSASCLALATINYMSRHTAIGGIYNRPILLGNTVYHNIAAISVAKYLLNTGDYSLINISLMAVYCSLGLWFFRLFFTSPNK